MEELENGTNVGGGGLENRTKVFYLKANRIGLLKKERIHDVPMYKHNQIDDPLPLEITHCVQIVKSDDPLPFKIIIVLILSISTLLVCI